jgi:hypothetical protein
MIKEFAFSISNRHHFQDANKSADWEGVSSDTFVSLYDYDEYVIEYYGKHKTLSGFDGNIYMPDEFLLDIDGEKPEIARQKLIGLLILLNDMFIPYKIYFSGRGFHVGIPSKAFRWQPCKDLHLKVKDVLKNAGIFDYADSSVTDKTRIIRLVNTKNTKSGLYKVQISEKMVQADEPIENIIKHAYRPQDQTQIEMECDPVFDVLSRNKKSKGDEIIIESQGRTPDPVNHTCIQRMLAGSGYGKRHAVALRIASYLRWRYPEDIVQLIMEDWRSKVDHPEHKFSTREMKSIVENCYTGHNGAGYRYGCNDQIMDEHCSSTCKLYKSKKSQTIMDAESMEKAIIDFYTESVTPLNIGSLYGQDFPIYPGEVVILQAPPASMKTMLLQNWATAFKKQTYFMEMEMSARQIWSRFVMIEMGWTEEELVEHYMQKKNGMDERFKWLTMDYSAPYPYELDKRISILNKKPEVVIVDHMGLFRSKQRDSNMKAEEVSQALSELAIKHNVIVFAVSEISKQAFNEGMNIASSKGSFRVAYNANKVLSLKPFKDKETGLIKNIQVVSDKNREKEHLNVLLKINNVRIEKDDQ